MRSKFIRFLTLFMVFVFQYSISQEKTITGTVSDSYGPIPSANVVVKGTTNGSTTDFDGNYLIKAKQGSVLVFSYVGKKSVEVSVGTSSTIDVLMKDDGIQLDDVVVEAYRTSSKPLSNIASTTVTNETIEGRPNASFIQTLQAQVPGLNIQTGSGQPGSSSTVILRGLGSINGNVEPLYVIDGVPQNGDNFRSLNPNEISTISVLKDAGATAIYGNRGANGVIVVTTKRGSYNQPLQMQYIGTSGFTQLQGNDYNMMSSREILAFEKQQGVGLGAAFTDSEIAAYDVNTNWQDEFFRTGITQAHTLNFTSGGADTNSFTSLGFSDQQGILKGSDLKRFNFRNNLTGRSENKRFNYSTNFTLNWSQRNEASGLGTGGVNRNYVLGANSSLPYVSPDMWVSGQQTVDDYGSDTIFAAYGSPLAGTLAYTPLFLIDKLNSFALKTDELKTIMNLRGSYDLNNNLTVSAQAGLDYTQNRNIQWESPESFNAILFLGDGQEFGGFEDHSMSRSLLANINANITYKKTFADKHTFEASLFTEYFKAHFDGFNYRQEGLDPKTTSPGAGTGYIPFDTATPTFYVPSVGASKASSGLFSYFGYVDYDFDQKYGFSGTLRRDASSRFNTSNRWGTFFSASARWNIDKEAFMDGSVFDALKLRASYGSAGNQDITGGGYFGSLNLTRDLYDATTGYGNSVGYGIVQIGNDDLKWETITTANIGVDFELFKQRLRGSLDVYQKKTTDLFLGQQISAINAITSLNTNIGSLQNSGVEFIAAYDLIKPANQGDFKLSLNFNASYNKNEILDLATENGLSWDGSSLTALNEGNQIGEFYVVEYAGVNPTNGNMLFYNSDGGLTEDPDPATDRVFTGKSRLPKYQGGFGFNADYKNFYASTLFSFVTDVWRYDYDYEGVVDPTSVGQFNLSTDLNDAWTPTNTDTYMPALGADNLSIDDFSDRFLKDASYVRMRFASVGYSFPKSFLEKSFFSGVKFFVQAENLVTWSKWRGWDAESNRSADQYQYPTPKIYTIGLELNF